MKKILFLIALLFFCLSPRPVLAADEGWTIEKFNSDLAVEQTGEVSVVETIDVNFNTLSKHGIYRDIPYAYESNGQKIYTEILTQKVEQNGAPATYVTSKNDTYVDLKIGDADRTISGKNTYKIYYTVRGVLRGFTDHDELYWNVTGNNWPVPINHATATVTLPSDGLTKTACYQGYAGSQGECLSQIQSPRIAEFQSDEILDAAQGMTIVSGYTKGMVPLLTVQRPKTFWGKFTTWPSELTLGIAVTFGIVTIFYLWYKGGRDYWLGQNMFGKINNQGSAKPLGAHETTVVEFTPPEKLRPAELGVLMDERADTHDVVATIIDLASRGYLTITEVPKKWIFGKMDYLLTKKSKDGKGLLGYEKMLLDKLFATEKTVTISSLKTTFYEELKEIKQELYNEVVRKKLFTSDPEKIRQKYLLIAFVLLILGIIITGNSVAHDLIIPADIGLGIGISGVILIIMSQFMPRRTASGRELYRRARGYYLFINTAEKYRQQFFEKKNMFNEILPYAIVFGLTTKFAQQMHDIGLTHTATAWYVGTQPFNTTTFGNSMNDFSRSMSSAIASAPQSSGFSGGSSGGGFGGGGGGSW